MFRVYCEQEAFDETKDSSTACWLKICKLINENSGEKRRPEKEITISGTERYGLTENIVRQELMKQPEAKNCSKIS